jgi:hypothetical protein
VLAVVLTCLAAHISPRGGTNGGLLIGYVPRVRSSGLTRAAGLVVAATVLSGCTTTVTGTATSAAGAHGSTPSGTHAQQQSAPDAAQLDRTVLQLSDLPAGWSAGAGGGPDQAVMRAVAGCLGARDGWTDVAVMSHASSFVDGAGDEVGSFAASYHSQQDVDDDAALLRMARASECFARAFDDEAGTVTAPAGTTFGAANFTVVAGSGGGPDNIAGVALGTQPVTTSSGTDTTIDIQFVLLTGRLTETQLFFLSTGGPLPAALRADAIAAAAQRTAAL